MSFSRTVAEAQALVAEQGGVLDAPTIAWLDQASTSLAEDTTMSVLVEAWNPQRAEESWASSVIESATVSAACTELSAEPLTTKPMQPPDDALDFDSRRR